MSGDIVITLIASVAIIGAFFLSFIPFMPATVLMWLVTVTYAWATGFRNVSWLAVIIVTIIALLAVTSDLWLPLIGMKGRGGSCSSAFGTFIGGLLGTFLIPIPIIGTLIGAIGGAIGMELLRVGDLRESLRAGSFAAKQFALSLILAIILNTIMLVVYFAALLIP